MSEKEEAFVAMLHKVKRMWEDEDGPQPKMRCLSELNSVCDTLSRLRDELKLAAEKDEAAQELTEAQQRIQAFKTRLVQIDAEMHALGAETHNGGLGCFPSHWIPHKLYLSETRAKMQEIAKKENEMKQFGQRVHSDFGNRDAYIKGQNSGIQQQILQIRQQINAVLFTRKPFDASTLQPKLDALNQEKTEIVYNLRMMECAGHVVALNIGPDYKP